MNFLFGFVSSSISAIVLLLAYFAVVRPVMWRWVPEPYHTHIRGTYAVATAVVFVAVLMSSLTAYGPQVELQHAQLPEVVEPMSVNPPEVEFIEPVDKWGSFNGALEKAPAKMPN